MSCIKKEIRTKVGGKQGLKSEVRRSHAKHAPDTGRPAASVLTADAYRLQLCALGLDDLVLQMPPEDSPAARRIAVQVRLGALPAPDRAGHSRSAAGRLARAALD